MRKLMFALAIAAGLAAPMATANAGPQWCQVRDGNMYCYPY